MSPHRVGVAILLSGAACALFVYVDVLSNRLCAPVDGNIEHGVMKDNHEVAITSLRLDPREVLEVNASVQTSVETSVVTKGRALPNNKATCPTFQPASFQLLSQKKDSKQPVRARRPPVASPTEHIYLFIIAGPYTGSTAMMGLASTSPASSNMCGRTSDNNCEGQAVLHTHGLFPDLNWGTISNPDLPKNWNEAVDAYAAAWDMSKQVLVEKSPVNVFKVAKIDRELTMSGRHARFLLLTRSPCDRHAVNKDMQRVMVQAMRSVPAERLLHVRYEELVADPWAQSQRIVDFLPELRSLDPTRSGAAAGGHGSMRASPVSAFALRSAAITSPLKSWRFRFESSSKRKDIMAMEIRLVDRESGVIHKESILSISASSGCSAMPQLDASINLECSNEAVPSWSSRMNLDDAPTVDGQDGWVQVDFLQPKFIARVHARQPKGGINLKWLEVLASNDNIVWWGAWHGDGTRTDDRLEWSQAAPQKTDKISDAETREFAEVFSYVERAQA